MIQFNLLPSVKLEYVRAKRNKRMTLLIAVLIAGTSLAILILLFVAVQLVQKKYSKDLSNDIKTQSSKLENTQDLNKILTIQNQLASLPGLHDDKPLATKLLGYVKQLTPSKISISDIVVDYSTQTVVITGASNEISTVNTFVDTIKFTTYKTQKNEEGKAFSVVVLSSFGKDEKGTKYEVTFKYDPIIFSNTDPAIIVIPPNKITTRSETEKPDALFQAPSQPSTGGQ